MQKATCSSQQSLYAVFRGADIYSHLGNKHEHEHTAYIPPLPPTHRTVKCSGHSTISVKEVAGTAFLFFTKSSPPLAIDLLELVALIAVAVALGIAIVITGRGSAALLWGLLCRWVPGSP